jgi:hypothetical protein
MIMIKLTLTLFVVATVVAATAAHVPNATVIAATPVGTPTANPSRSPSPHGYFDTFFAYLGNIRVKLRPIPGHNPAHPIPDVIDLGDLARRDPTVAMRLAGTPLEGRMVTATYLDRRGRSGGIVSEQAFADLIRNADSGEVSQIAKSSFNYQGACVLWNFRSPAPPASPTSNPTSCDMLKMIFNGVEIVSPSPQVSP